eukprot:COSAG04_NODE_93_length_26686_cov_10.174364_24_plen_69_part_00
MRAVSPSSSVASGSALSRTSADTAPACPLRAALHTAGVPRSFFASGLAPSAASHSIAATSPSRAALQS